MFMQAVTGSNLQPALLTRITGIMAVPTDRVITTAETIPVHLTATVIAAGTAMPMMRLRVLRAIQVTTVVQLTITREAATTIVVTAVAAVIRPVIRVAVLTALRAAQAVPIAEATVAEAHGAEAEVVAEAVVHMVVEAVAVTVEVAVVATAVAADVKQIVL
jgi:hypothetical protein